MNHDAAALRRVPPSRHGWPIGRAPSAIRVRRRIGAGTMGTVYEAFDRERGQSVALKKLRHFSPAALYLLQARVSDAGRRRTTPNLVRLHELVATEAQ